MNLSISWLGSKTLFLHPCTRILFLSFVTVSALGLRLYLAPYVSGDMKYFLFGWYDYLKSTGFASFKREFTNYTPAYTYLLYISTLYSGMAKKVLLIKTISILFDFAAAIAVFQIIRLRYPETLRPHLAYALTLFLPTLVINGSYWGQCDIIFTTFLLMSFLAILQDRPYSACTAFGIAFSFKFQAFFFAPFLFCLVLHKKIKLRHLSIAPVIYCISAIPCLIAGRPFWKVLTVYWSQANSYYKLSGSTGSFFAFFRDMHSDTMAFSAVFVTTMLMILFGLVIRRSKFSFNIEAYTLLALVSVALSPYLLPKMHDRYFFAADVFSLVLAFLNPAYIFPVIGFQITSLLVYSYVFPAYSNMMTMAAVLNGCLIIWLLCRLMAELFPRTYITGSHFLKPLSILCCFMGGAIAYILWITLVYILSGKGISLWPMQKSTGSRYIYAIFSGIFIMLFYTALNKASALRRTGIE